MRRFFFLLTLLLLCAIGMEAQETEFVEFTDRYRVMSGIAPSDWDPMSDVEFHRHATSRDVTSLTFRARNIEMDRVLYERAYYLGLEEMPEADTQIQGVVSWDVWHVATDRYDVDYAVAESGRLLYEITLVSRSEEEAELRETVFVPVVEALTPLEENVDFEFFSSEEAGVTGRAPITWISENQSTDNNFSAPDELYQYFAGISVNVLDTDAESYLAQGIEWGTYTEVPEPFMQIEGFLLWDIRQWDFIVIGRNVRGAYALSEYNGFTYLATLSALVEDYDALFEVVFVPFVDSLMPFSYEVPMEAFVSEEFGLQGLIPSGWTLAADGSYMWQRWEGDLTLLRIGSEAGSTNELLERFASELNINLEDIYSLGHLYEPLEWEFWGINRTVGEINLWNGIATVEYAGKTFFVFVEGAQVEADFIHDEILHPVAVSISPLD